MYLFSISFQKSFYHTCFDQAIAACVVENLNSNREIMIYRDTLKNQQFQVRNFKRILKRQGDKHPAVIISKLLIFPVASFFSFLSNHPKGQFFKEVWKERAIALVRVDKMLRCQQALLVTRQFWEPLKALGTGAGDTGRLQAVPLQQLSHGAVADAASGAVTHLQPYSSGTVIKAEEIHFYSLQIQCLELVLEGRHNGHSFLQRTKQS